MKKNLALLAFAVFTFGALAITGCKPDDGTETVKVTAVTVTPDSETLMVGQTLNLGLAVAPADATDRSVEWKSSNTDVATVSASGVVSAKGAGSATITATANDGSGKSDACALTVIDPASFTVSIAGDGFDIAEQITIMESEAGAKQVKVNVAATGGIDKLMIEITSSSAIFSAALVEMGFDANADLANPTGKLLESLSSLEGLLPFGNEVKNKTALPFDITNFIPMIYMVTADEGWDVTAEFKLTAHDAYNHSDSKTLKLRLIRERKQLPNGGFESWSSRNNTSTGAVTTWYPYAGYPETTSRFWDTANGGLNLAGQAAHRNPTAPSDDVRPGSTGTKSVIMNSHNVRILVVSKFAAGNLFTGEFGSINMNEGGATVHFGQPFTSRPTALKGWFKANAGTITHAGEGSPKAVGQPDEYQIFVALTTWEGKHQMDTWNPATFFNPETDPGVIGFAEKSGTGAVAEWTEFNIPITYTSDEMPTHIVIVATSSKYGDYFTGSTDSWLQVDDFELVY